MKKTILAIFGLYAWGISLVGSYHIGKAMPDPKHELALLEKESECIDRLQAMDSSYRKIMDETTNFLKVNQFDSSEQSKSISKEAIGASKW